MIQLHNVSKEYKLDGEILIALDNANMRITAGDFIAVVGPSGCGKSTLMHILGLLDTPTKGTIMIKGQDVSDLSDNQLSKLRNEFVGFVFQQFNLINKLTVLENILLPIIYARKKIEFDPRQKAIELTKRFGIEDKINSYPHKLSGGQQQRVAISRALINNPQVILADEPTGNLDSKTGKNILSLLTELNNKDKIAICMVTHDSDVAKKAKKQVYMLDGKIIPG